MKRIILLQLLLIYAGASVAQSEDDVFYFKTISSKLDESNADIQFVGDHFLGKSIAVKLEILRDSYTWTEPASPTVPTPRLVIEKPIIYNNVRKVEKFYKKELKGGTMSLSQAQQEFDTILNIAIYIRNQETIRFEEKLKSLKEETEIVALFTQSVKLASNY